jgi:hypothetical protein
MDAHDFGRHMRITRAAQQGIRVTRTASRNESAPALGDGATYTVWTDSFACTVIAVSATGKVVTLQRDKATRVDSNGISEAQEYVYEPDPDGETFRVSLRSNGQWKLVGQSTKEPGGHAHMGVRRRYHDYSF